MNVDLLLTKSRLFNADLLFCFLEVPTRKTISSVVSPLFLERLQVKAINYAILYNPQMADLQSVQERVTDEFIKTWFPFIDTTEVPNAIRFKQY